MGNKQVRLAWGGSLTAQSEADLAYAQLKPKKTKATKKKKKPFNYYNYLASKKWRSKRRHAIAAAKGRCSICMTTERLQVHHNNYTRIGREHPGDLTVLCGGCHRNKHEKDGVCDPLTKEYLKHTF